MTTDDRGCGMTWDFDNMLQSFAANGVTDLKNATYEYDAIGRRVAKNVAETGGTQTTVFVQAGQQVTCEYTPGNSTADCDRKYAYGSYIDEVLNYVDATPAPEVRYWLNQNRQYSNYTTTGIAGTVIERLRYDACGKQSAHAPDGTALSGSNTTSPHIAFQGCPVNGESDTVHFRARTYLTSLARFASRDPLVYVDGGNMFAAYFQLTDTDPTGMICEKNCNTSLTWSPSDCDENREGGPCKCSDGKQFELGGTFPIGEIGNSIRHEMYPDLGFELPPSNIIPNIPRPPNVPKPEEPDRRLDSKCNVKFVVGRTGFGKPNWGRTCARDNGRDILIVIEPGTDFCTARALLMHELIHAAQFCNNGMVPNQEFPPKGMTCKEAERQAYKVSCAREADQECMKEPDRTTAINKCIENGIMHSCEKQVGNGPGDLPSCTTIFSQNGS
ncbi:MAG: hypothetical protein JNM43_23045 [Planctomycetaceae bacterium]|nr:hypothetical protein [Planctomycetaceae bacterium]